METLFTEMLLMNGFVTLKLTELLVLSPTLTVTPTVPAIRRFGTAATMEVLLQLVVDAGLPPNLTVLVPLVEPKLVPVMVTEVPDAPEVGDRLVIDGGVGLLTVKV